MTIIIEALRAARDMIAIERQSFVDCHSLPGGTLDAQAIMGMTADTIGRDLLSALVTEIKLLRASACRTRTTAPGEPSSRRGATAACTAPARSTASSTAATARLIGPR